MLELWWTMQQTQQRQKEPFIWQSITKCLFVIHQKTQCAACWSEVFQTFYSLQFSLVCLFYSPFFTNITTLFLWEIIKLHVDFEVFYLLTNLIQVFSAFLTGIGSMSYAKVVHYSLYSCCPNYQLMIILYNVLFRILFDSWEMLTVLSNLKGADRSWQLGPETTLHVS